MTTPVVPRLPQLGDLPGCQSYDSGTGGPHELEVAGARLTALVKPDLVEPGELVVVTGHQCQELHDIALVGQDLHVCGARVAEETDLHRFPCTQVAHPGKLGTDEQAPFVAAVGDRDSVAPPRFAANRIHGD